MDAAVFTWDGGAANNQWQTPANWVGDIAPGLNSGAHTFRFAGGTRLNAAANSGNWSIGGIEFSSNAGAFELSGGGLTLGADGVINDSTADQTINNQITLGANQEWNAAAGALIVNGYVGGNGKSLTLDGASAIRFNNQLNGVGTLNIDGAGDRTFNGYTSTTTLNAGGTGTSTYNAHVHTTTVNVTSGSHVFSSKVNASNLYISGGTTTYSGAASKDIGRTVVDGGTLRLAGSGSQEAFKGSLVVNDGGTVAFEGNNQVAHWQTVTLNEGSTLLLGNTTQVFTKLVITGDSVIDFGTGGSTLNLTDYWNGVVVSDNVTLTILNWDHDDVFMGSNPGENIVNINYADNDGRIYATATWGGSGGGTSFITPGNVVPEPSSYGLMILGAGLGFVLWRRRKAAQ